MVKKPNLVDIKITHMEKNRDKIVRELLGVVEQKKAEIAKAEKPKWETNCSWSYDKNGQSRTNLQTVTDVNEIGHMLGFLYETSGNFQKAKETLGVDTEFKWLGFTEKEWLADFKTRVNKIQITKKKAELAEIESKLEKLVSKEERERIELENIQKALLG